MTSRYGSPIAFLLTGFSWLVLSSFLGLAILVGMVRGTPLPSWLRLIHAHGALVGGIAQMILGGALAFLPSRVGTKPERQRSHPLLFLSLNASTVGLLVGFWLHRYEVVGAAGLLVAAAFLWAAWDTWAQIRPAPQLLPASVWYVPLALLALFAGLAAGEAMTWGLMPQSYGYLRLAHIHLILLGFMTLAVVGTMPALLRSVLHASPAEAPLSRLMPLLVTLGIATLVGGFLNSSVPVELAAGAVLFAGAAFYALNLFKTWAASTHPGNAASDHLLIGTFFLLLTILVGMLVGANTLETPSVMPYGTLHLIAYTHMALLGFLLNTVMGVLSHAMPLALAADRVPNSKKRAAYLERLTAVMNRWRTLQIGGLSLGTMGLALLASLTWNMPLASVYVQVTLWTCFGLLLSSLVLFSSKLTQALSLHPGE